MVGKVKMFKIVSRKNYATILDVLFTRSPSDFIQKQNQSKTISSKIFPTWSCLIPSLEFFPLQKSEDQSCSKINFLSHFFFIHFRKIFQTLEIQIASTLLWICCQTWSSWSFRRFHILHQSQVFSAYLIQFLIHSRKIYFHHLVIQFSYQQLQSSRFDVQVLLQKRKFFLRFLFDFRIFTQFNHSFDKVNLTLDKNSFQLFKVFVADFLFWTAAKKDIGFVYRQIHKHFHKIREKNRRIVDVFLFKQVLQNWRAIKLLHFRG